MRIRALVSAGLVKCPHDNSNRAPEPFRGPATIAVLPVSDYFDLMLMLPPPRAVAGLVNAASSVESIWLS